MKKQKTTVTQTPNIKAIKGRGVSHKLSSLWCPRYLFLFCFLNEQSDE